MLRTPALVILGTVRKAFWLENVPQRVWSVSTTTGMTYLRTRDWKILYTRCTFGYVGSKSLWLHEANVLDFIGYSRLKGCIKVNTTNVSYLSCFSPRPLAQSHPQAREMPDAGHADGHAAALASCLLQHARPVLRRLRLSRSRKVLPQHLRQIPVHATRSADSRLVHDATKYSMEIFLFVSVY